MAVNMNLLDRAIGYVAPRAALRRVAARNALGRLERLYDAAQSGRRDQGWVTTGSDATSEALLSRPQLRRRSRDLVRNNPWAPSGIRRYASNVTGMVPRAKARSPEVAKAADELFKSWAAWADADGVTNFRGIETLMLRSLVTDGEVLLQKIPRSPREGLPVPLQVKLLEVDHLDETRDTTNERVVGGIKFDADGRRQSYKLRLVHPGSSNNLDRRTVDVPASDILHIYEPLRPGAVFGVSWLAPAILKLRDIELLDEAELVRQQVQSCLVGVIETPDPEMSLTGDVKDEDKPRIEAKKRLIEGFSPGMVAYTAPGEKVTFNSPSGPAGSDSLYRVQLMAIAAALGMPYELLTGDLSQVSFISGRLGLMQWRLRVREIQDTILVPQALDEVWDWFVFYAQLAGKLPIGEEIGVEWAPPLMESAQPVDDATEELLRIRSGTMSLFDALARRGYDAEAKIAEIAQVNALLDQNSIILDSDPRKVSKGGTVQSPDLVTDAGSKPDPAAARREAVLRLANGHLNGQEH